MQDDSVRVVLQAARRAARATDAPLLLAVSGGLDSMALLAAMATVARPKIAAVATFDHGTGPAAARAVRHVMRVARAMGIPAVAGRISRADDAAGGREAAWRRRRHEFLRNTARTLGARVVMAHTEDDQLETVLMRIMRGSGTRGLAGLLAPTGPIRPFIAVRRATLARYLETTGYGWVEDPSNVSREFLRNRVRHDLLPALRTVHPNIDGQLLDTGRRAAAWRAGVERVIDDTISYALAPGGSLTVSAAELAGHTSDSLAVLWSALAGRVGLALDRRGTDRIVAFTMSGSRAGSMPLSGGWWLESKQGRYHLRRGHSPRSAPTSLPMQGAIEWGSFRFRVADETTLEGGGWSAALPLATVPTVRAWGAGDRLESSGGQPKRRVKRYLSDAGVRGTDRASWPVVVAGQDVVWIPGVRRSDAATARSGGPIRHYVCERIDR